MTGRMVIDHQLALNEGQLRKAVAGLGNDALDFRPHATAMSLREQLEHLTLVYMAVVSEARGEKIDWNAYSGTGKNIETLVADVFAKRNDAVAAYAGKEDDASLQALNGWIVLHDNYHIGQLALIHHAVDPEWDSLSLYE